MFPPLATGEGFGARLAVVHFRGDVLALPRGQDARVEVDDVFGAFADLVGVEDDVVVMVVEHEWDVEFLADGQEFVHAPAHVVVLQDEAILDVLRKSGVVFPKAGEGGFFVAEDAAEVEDHDGVTILLIGEFEEGEHFGVVVEVAESVVDDGFPRGTELGVLAWVGSQPVAEFCGDFTGLGEGFRCERSKFVTVFLMGGEGKHFAAEAHELDAVAVVPAKHLGDVAHIG